MRTSRPTLTLLAAFAALGGFLSFANAQSVATTPVGAVSLNALANSDSLYSIPLVRDAIFTGTVSSVSGNVLTLAGASFTASQLQYQAGVQSNTYYAQLASGQALGQFSTIVTNGTTSVTCEFESDVLASIQVSDKVVIRPYWTLGTLFPASAAGSSFIASTSNFASGRRTEILFPDAVGQGINKSASSIYFFFSNWRKSGDTTANRNDVIITPDSYITIRGNNSAVDTKLTVVGEVQPYSNTVPLLSITSGQNDNPVALSIAVDTPLSDLNLVGSGKPFVVSTSNFASGRGDELIVFNNSTVGQNKSASAIYFFFSNWRKSGDTTPNQNTTIIPAGSAIIIRKKASVANQVSDWVQNVAVVAN